MNANKLKEAIRSSLSLSNYPLNEDDNGQREAQYAAGYIKAIASFCKAIDESLFFLQDDPPEDILKKYPETKTLVKDLRDFYKKFNKNRWKKLADISSGVVAKIKKDYNLEDTGRCIMTFMDIEMRHPDGRMTRTGRWVNPY